MDLLTTILSCSLYIADDGLVRAIAESTAQSNPYFVLDASVDPTQVDPPAAAKSPAEAAARASEILGHGGRPVLGLLQVPPAWLTAFGLELPAAFDPCANIAVGTAMLSEFDAQCAPLPSVKRLASPSRPGGGASSRRACILRKYEEAIGLPDFAAVTRLELRYQKLARPPIEAAPIFAPDASRHFGPDQLLVSVSPLSIASPIHSTP
jgi:hypothetical protein